MPAAPSSARLLGLATAVPPHRLPQNDVRLAAGRILGSRFADFERLAGSFANSGIANRYSVVPFEWFETEKDWPDRTGAYLEGAVALFVTAAERALANAGLAAEDIDIIVTVSSTGISTPTLEARAMRRMGFRADVQRVPVFGLGCAGGVTGLSLAARLAAAAPGSKVLFVCVEACTLAFRSNRLEKADIIATILFGDGAAAAVLSTGEEGPEFGAGAEHTWPDTLRIMGWEVERDGFGVVFDRSIPDFIKENFARAVDGMLQAMDRSREHVRRLICHPGGAKVVDAIEAALHLDQGTLDHERDVLRDYGNMSAPTVLFVLERLLAANPQGEMILAALGPGFTASLLPIRFN
jgi:alkylresorcinol/alkylpyrone synthase